MDRRQLLKAMALGSSVGGGLSSLGLLAQKSALAQSGTDYKALVCVYLFGGNDGYNTFVPYEIATHSLYLTMRPEYKSTSKTGLGVPRNALLPMQPLLGNESALLGLHPALARTHELWEQGQVACVRNIGNLVEPLTRTNFSSRRKPLGIGGHSEQQEISMIALQDPQGSGAENGWAARMLSAAQQRGLTSIDTLSQVSFAGQNRWQASPQYGSLILGPNELISLDNPSQIKPLLDQGLVSARALTKVYSRQIAQAYSMGEKVNAVFGNSVSVASESFSSAVGGSQGGLQQQLLAVARFIEARNQLQVPGRQVFFVAAGGYDTHEGQYDWHSSLLSELDSGLYGFSRSMNALGMTNQVTTFLMSDFGRTPWANASHGTDHGWASNLMVMGGAVKGGLYGREADLMPESTDVTSFDQNLVIPSTSINQYAATLAAWMGLSPTDLNAVFPDLRNFAQPNLGFMNS